MAQPPEQVTVSGDDLARAAAIRAQRATAYRIRAHRQQRAVRRSYAPQESHARGASAGPRPAVGRPMALRANRVTNGALGVFGLLVVVALAYGIYRAAMQSVASGSVVIVTAAMTLVAVGRRLGPGRLLVLKVNTAAVTLTNSWQPEAVIERTAALRAVLWVHPRFKTAAPTARGLFLFDDDGDRSFSRPYTFTPERLRRFLAAAGIPVEVVDASDASTALAAGASRAR